MKRLILICFLCGIFSCIFSTHSIIASEVFNYGGPKTEGMIAGWMLNGNIQADDFMLDSKTLLTGAKFWIGEAGCCWNNTINYYIYADDNGTPDLDPIFSGTGKNIFKSDPLRTYVHNYMPLEEYYITFDFQNFIALEGGVRYWFGLNVSTGWEGLTTRWETTDSGFGDSCFGRYIDSNNNNYQLGPWGVNNSQYAFSLFGEPQGNNDPILDPIGPKTVNEGEPLEFTINGHDPDYDPLTFFADNLPPGAAFNPETRTFSWTPGFNQAENYEVPFSVQDNSGGVDVETVTITVGNTNRAPVFYPVGPQQSLEGQFLHFSVLATDPDGDPIFYTAESLPSGANFDPNTKFFSWMPNYSQTGTYTVTFYATDSGGMVGETSVVISINQPTPSELINQMASTLSNLPVSTSVQNSYVANFKKVDIFIAKGQKTAAVNQLQSLTNKVTQDLSKGTIRQSDAALIIQMANELLSMLN